MLAYFVLVFGAGPHKRGQVLTIHSGWRRATMAWLHNTDEADWSYRIITLRGLTHRLTKPVDWTDTCGLERVLDWHTGGVNPLTSL